MKLSIFVVSVCALVSGSGLAFAREAGESRIIMHEGPNAIEVSVCQSESPDSNVVISACTAALGVVKDPTSTSVLLLWRSKAHSRAGNFQMAITDADDAQVVLDSWQAQNQRCWTRVLAYRDLDVAAEACDAAIGRSGARAPALDSGATLALLKHDWERASQLFWLISKAYGGQGAYSHAQFGIYLAFKEMAEMSSGDLQLIWREKADAQRANIADKERVQYSSYFLSLGISNSK